MINNNINNIRTFEHTISFVMLCCILNPCGPFLFLLRCQLVYPLGVYRGEGKFVGSRGHRAVAWLLCLYVAGATVSVSDLPLYKIINKANMICIM